MTQPGDRADDSTLPSDIPHLVGNLLALVRSVLDRTVRSDAAPEEMLEHFRGRLDALGRRAIARARTPSETVDLEDLLREELRDFQFGHDPRIVMAGPEVAITHDAAQVLGLAAQELVTNALKFGALSVEGASLTIRWTAQDQRLRLLWRETGVRIVEEAPRRAGFGRDYLEHAVPFELGGTSVFELLPGGVRWEIVMAYDSPPAHASDNSLKQEAR